MRRFKLLALSDIFNHKGEQVIHRPRSDQIIGGRVSIKKFITMQDDFLFCW